jgi:hypothetical protein
MLPSKISSFRLIKLRRPLLLAAILIGFACAGGDENDFWSMFQPETATTRPGDDVYRFSPMLYNGDMYGFDITTIDDSLANRANVEAWRTYLGKSAISNELIRSGLADTADSNPFVSRVMAANPNAADYLDFAYAAQRAEGPRGEPWEAVASDTAQLRFLAEKARLEANGPHDVFLRERYAYQAVKLAVAMGDYAASRKAYQELVDPLEKKTFISDWARSRYAGALLRAGERDRALYEFAQVFATCPSRRHAAERSVRVWQVRFTDEALALAKTNAERVAVYALSAIQPKQDALPMLEKMVELDPKNPLNELVLAREINRNEYYSRQTRWMGYVENDKTRTDSVNFEKRRTSVADYNGQLLAFAEKAATNTALGNPAFYGTAAAYLHYLSGDYAAAKTALDAAAQQPTASRGLKQQIALQQMLLLSAQPGVPDATAETQFATYLTQFKQERVYSDEADVPPFNTRFAYATEAAGKQMANRYLGTSAAEKKGGGWLSGCSSKETAVVAGPNAAKAFLLRVIATQANNWGYPSHDRLLLEDTTGTGTARAVLDFVLKPTGETDQQLAKLAGFDADAAYQLVGRRSIAEGNYQAAAEAFGRVKPAYWRSETVVLNTPHDPFFLNAPDEMESDEGMLPLKFVQQMADYQAKAKLAEEADKTGNDVAKLYYELGCGAYNLSYWGNAWLLNHRAWSSSEPPLYGLPDGPDPERTYARVLADPYYTNSIAQQFFEKAAKVAQSPDMAAKATYLAARCQYDALQVRREVEKQKRGGYVPDDDAAFIEHMNGIARAEYGSLGDTFRQQYGRTRFAQDAQTNCALYKDVVGQ